jgi:thiol-disulfide isomerase/thioredoxin
MQFVNHYSAVILWLLLLAGGISVVVRRGKKPHQWAVLGGLLLVMTTVWFVLRPVATLPEAAGKQPSLLEIQSPFCLACLAHKAEVDRAEQELKGRVAFRRVDIQSGEGGKLAEQYGIERTPSFIFFDEAGEEQWRSIGKLDLPRLRSSVSSPH